jgi:hypothetical protein
VNAEDAFFGNPFSAFFLQECFHSVVSNILQILDFAHTVFRSIAAIHEQQSLAGEFVAIVTEWSVALFA